MTPDQFITESLEMRILVLMCSDGVNLTHFTFFCKARNINTITLSHVQASVEVSPLREPFRTFTVDLFSDSHLFIRMIKTDPTDKSMSATGI